ncbi:uncharacterized [Tachysurus ichikawai]
MASAPVMRSAGCCRYAGAHGEPGVNKAHCRCGDGEEGGDSFLLRRVSTWTRAAVSVRLAACRWQRDPQQKSSLLEVLDNDKVAMKKIPSRARSPFFLFDLIGVSLLY